MHDKCIVHSKRIRHGVLVMLRVVICYIELMGRPTYMSHVPRGISGSVCWCYVLEILVHVLWRVVFYIACYTVHTRKNGLQKFIYWVGF